MSLGNMLGNGFSMTGTGTLGQRFANAIGRLRAVWRKQVKIGKDCRISPDAWIHPRGCTIHLDDHVSVGPGAMLQGNLKIGPNSSVQAYCVLVGYPDGKIHIGEGVRIASHTVMVAAEHCFDRLDLPIRDQGLRQAPIVIEDDVWLGSRVNVTSGVTIGKGSVIGAGAVVTHDIPPNSIAVGVPAKVIRSRV